MGFSARWLSCLICVVALFLAPCLWVSACAQGLPQSPYSAPSMVRSGLDLAPSNPLSAPRGVSTPGSGSILFTPQLLGGILPLVPNLEFGYLYNFGQGILSGRFTIDYLLPIELGKDAVVFGEAHAESQGFGKGRKGTAHTRTDISVGGGYRRMIGDDLLVGVNSFFDATRLGRPWHTSLGVGADAAFLIGGHDALDLNFNWYGLPHHEILVAIFQKGRTNYDFEAGYSHELYAGGPDLRLHATGYRFDSGSGVIGWRAGAELKTRDGAFSLKYEAGHDRLNYTYHTVGGFLNIGFQVENLLNGESPFTAPEPIFRSPRNLRRLLASKVHRTWNQILTSKVHRTWNQIDTGACAPCNGFAIYRSGYLPLDTFLDTEPTLLGSSPPTKIRVSWCRVEEAPSAITNWTLCDGANRVQYREPHITPGEGSEVVTSLTGLVDSEVGWQYRSLSTEIRLGEGGYICIEFLD